MKNNINEIMSKYTAGEIPLEQANEELKAAGAGFHLEHLTEEERAACPPSWLFRWTAGRISSATGRI